MWFARGKDRGKIALGIQPEGVACAWFRPNKDGALALQACDYLPAQGREQAPALKEWLQRHRLTRSRCRLVLAPQLYRIQQLEAPQVPSEEMHSAIRWRVKEMLDYPVEQAVVDYIDIPPRRQGSQSMVYAITARESLIAQQLELVRELGLKPQSIDVAELALRNLARLTPEDNRGALMLYLGSQGGMINIFANGTLFLTRRLEISAPQLAGSLGQPGGGDELQLDANQDPLLENLVLELQRSLDYYERSFGQQPINSLVVSPTEPALPQLISQLNARLGVMARQLDLTALFQCPSKPSDQQQMQCLMSVGAALREEAA